MNILYRIGNNSKFVVLNSCIMVENSFRSNFCFKFPTVKKAEGAGAICRRIVVVNRPRGTIPIQSRHLSGHNLHTGRKIKNKKAAKELGFSLIMIVEPLRNEGQ